MASGITKRAENFIKGKQNTHIPLDDSKHIACLIRIYPVISSCLSKRNANLSIGLPCKVPT